MFLAYLVLLTVTPADKEFYTHNGVEYSYTLSDADNKKYRLSFLPSRADGKNKRTDYLAKVLNACGHSADSQEQLNKILESIWKGLFIRQELVRAENSTYKLDCSKIRLVKPTQYYLCPQCHHITPFYLFGVCPTYRCDGHLKPADPNMHHKSPVQADRIRRLSVQAGVQAVPDNHRYTPFYDIHDRQYVSRQTAFQACCHFLCGMSVNISTLVTRIDNIFFIVTLLLYDQAAVQNSSLFYHGLPIPFPSSLNHQKI